MKLLLFHCKHLKFKDIRKSTRPIGIMQNGKVTAQEYRNVLSVFVCVEKWDTEEFAMEASKIIKEHLDFIKRNRAVVIPFAHLSNYIAPYKKAIMLLDEIAEELRNKNVEVGRATFGYHKDFEFMISDLVAYGHPGSVAFRRIPFDPEEELLILAKEVGLKKVYNALKENYGGEID